MTIRMGRGREVSTRTSARLAVNIVNVVNIGDSDAADRVDATQTVLVRASACPVRSAVRRSAALRHIPYVVGERLQKLPAGTAHMRCQSNDIAGRFCVAGGGPSAR
jgi:hypothetical protein